MKMTHKGPLVLSCRVAGERHEDDVYPHNANGMQLSKDRFLLLLGTMGTRHLDDARSIVYQLRAGSYTGEILSEGLLAATDDDWRPYDDGTVWSRQLGHPVGFGVPKGACYQGRPLTNANVFAARWRVVGRRFDAARGILAGPENLSDDRAGTDLRRVAWVHFRLNELESDIEIIEAETLLHQVGSPSPHGYCEVPLVDMNIGYQSIPPVDGQGLAWLDVLHGHDAHGNAGVAVMRYEWDVVSGRYVWAGTGPLLIAPGRSVMEGSILPWQDRWVVAARAREGAGPIWFELPDPLGVPTRVVQATEPGCIGTPLTAYTCADGVIRLFTGETSRYPHPGSIPGWVKSRNPLYCWEIDPETGFRPIYVGCVFDALKADVRIAEAHWPVCDYAKVLPHAGGRTQVLIHRVRPSTCRAREPDLERVHGDRVYSMTQESLEDAGVYAASLTYDRCCAGVWTFSSNQNAEEAL